MKDLDVVQRTPLTSADVTGARLHRLVLSDGRELIEKIVDARTDWLMRASGDDGRIHRLWRGGVIQRLPAEIDSAIEDAQPVDGVRRVLMRDVGASLVPDGEPITRAQNKRAMAAASALHGPSRAPRSTACAPSSTASLSRRHGPCGLATTTRCAMSSSRAGIDSRTPLPSTWPSPVLALAENPEPLAAALGSFPSTLLHGDLKVANLGFTPDAVVVLDCGTLTCIGPAALDLAWYVAVNSSAVDARLDELRSDVEKALAPDDRAALPLALLGQVVLLGSEKSLGATSDNEGVRAREQAGLLWWCARAAEAFERWLLR